MTICCGAGSLPKQRINPTWCRKPELCMSKPRTDAPKEPRKSCAPSWNASMPMLLLQVERERFSGSGTPTFIWTMPTNHRSAHCARMAPRSRRRMSRMISGVSLRRPVPCLWDGSLRTSPLFSRIPMISPTASSPMMPLPG
ncbi:hypothetical protein D3C75_700200 [compost metagenome]